MFPGCKIVKRVGSFFYLAFVLIGNIPKIGEKHGYSRKCQGKIFFLENHFIEKAVAE